jgi:hypothetical protein
MCVCVCMCTGWMALLQQPCAGLDAPPPPLSSSRYHGSLSVSRALSQLTSSLRPGRRGRERERAEWGWTSSRAQGSYPILSHRVSTSPHMNISSKMVNSALPPSSPANGNVCVWAVAQWRGKGVNISGSVPWPSSPPPLARWEWTRVATYKQLHQLRAQVDRGAKQSPFCMYCTSGIQYVLRIP